MWYLSLSKEILNLSNKDLNKLSMPEFWQAMDQKSLGEISDFFFDKFPQKECFSKAAKYFFKACLYDTCFHFDVNDKLHVFLEIKPVIYNRMRMLPLPSILC